MINALFLTPFCPCGVRWLAMAANQQAQLASPAVCHCNSLMRAPCVSAAAAGAG